MGGYLPKSLKFGGLRKGQPRPIFIVNSQYFRDSMTINLYKKLQLNDLIMETSCWLVEESMTIGDPITSTFVIIWEKNFIKSRE